VDEQNPEIVQDLEDPDFDVDDSGLPHERVQFPKQRYPNQCPLLAVEGEDALMRRSSSTAFDHPPFLFMLQ
jgi:hypothetical protein